ncbi:MAG TPA: zinc-binding alcohol dehydrogenase family protein, partial [Gaiellaceae bacterium]|nr:zinc-binding alcohol dehydrogenase family protein [Gaiellaceae bacterium]
CSPGAYSSGLTRAVICADGFSTDTIRNVPESEKHAVEIEYGMAPASYGSTLEIDHIVPLELGGSNDAANLFPERAPGYHAKDRLENKLHDLVCSGRMQLRAAQRGISADWPALYAGSSAPPRLSDSRHDMRMRAMVLTRQREPLELRDLPVPEPGPGQIRLRVLACGVCRTDLHVVDGDLEHPKLPLVPGHQIVGETDDGRRLGVPWLGWTDGTCRYCTTGRENLCDEARFTGYDIDGGYAEYAVADERFCFPLPDGYPDLQAAPLLCAGLIGWRSLRFAGDATRLGLYGFGASAHIVAQVARHQGRRLFGFVRHGDEAARAFALELGCEWAGWSDERPPEELDAAIVFAPVGALVPAALAALAKGGCVVCAGIHMSDIPSFPYELLWEERAVRSVANLTRRDGEEFLALAPQVPVRTEIETYALEDANDALDRLRRGEVRGAAVLHL